MTEKLKQCPHCCYTKPGMYANSENAYVKCYACGTSGPEIPPKESEEGDIDIEAALKEAINAWNSLPRRNEWQPAKTAPEDGRNILALLEGSRIPVVLYFGQDGKSNKPRWRKTLRPWCQYVGVPFTHWMQLPDPPENG